MTSSNDQLQTCLKQYFGFDDFLDYQQEVVEAINDGSDYCVVMPTGAGKSLCYQLPILMRPGYGIVVSPLIALMKDQIDALRAKNIPAGAINSAIDYVEQRETLQAVRNGEIKLLYVAPERFDTESFHNFLTQYPPSILIVDEAHCISQWGHDFRPAYTRLGRVATEYNIPQVCAFTATATIRVREDIKQQLRREGMQFHVAGFKRPNLAFKVIECRGGGAKDEALQTLLQEPIHGATIVYAATRKQVDELVSRFHCLGYHAGMSDDDRNAVQEEFMTLPSPVLAATNAFGMGIDRSDVRRVIHYNLTGSLEAYYQEAGRAGRDGEPSECILLFSYADRYVQEFLIELSNPPTDLLRRLYKELVRMDSFSRSDELNISTRDLASRLDVKNDSQIYSALRILEHYQLLSRGGRSDRAGTLQLRGNATLLEQMHASEKTQRSRFIHRFLREYGLNAVQPTFAELVELTGLNIDQLRRVMHYLDGDVLAWTPAPATSLITLTHPEKTELDIDVSELERKRRFELGRLDDVVEYARTKGCRQRALISYFGENDKNWQCTACDNCDKQAQLTVGNKHTLSDDELDGVLTMLECVSRFNGRFGRGKISMLLCGARRSELTNFNLHTTEYFGALRRWKQNEILDYLRALEDAGFLQTTDSEYPCLMLTNDGEDFIDCPSELELCLRSDPYSVSAAAKSPAKAKKKVSVLPASEQDRRLLERNDLFEELRQLRLAKAQARRVRAYQIFSDAVLRELVIHLPLTVEESLSIKGVGPQMAKAYMPDVIEVICRWRSENTLLD